MRSRVHPEANFTMISFYSTLNTDMFLLLPRLRKGILERSLGKHMEEKRIGPLKHKAVVSIQGLYHVTPFLVSPPVC